MRAIFLDIDGVLNSAGFLQNLPDLAPGENWEDRAELMLDRACVDRVDRLAAEARAGVVVSSSWRHGHALASIVAALRRRGYGGPVLGATPIIAGPRGNEIGAWLDEHLEVDAFVILDDETDMGDLSGRLVRTDWSKGMTEADLETALRMFEVG